MSRDMERVRDAQRAYLAAEGTPREKEAYAELVRVVRSVQQKGRAA